MTTEVWLKANTRVLWLGMILPTFIASVGLLLILGLPGRAPATWMRAVGAAALLFGGGLIGALAWQMRKPRLAYGGRQLLVWMRPGPPIRVPIEHVECFLLGQGPSMLPGRARHTETATLLIRIAEAAEQWHHQEVKPQLGAWCGGYVTVRGTWCEPLSVPLVNRLNQRLAEVSRANAS